MKKRTISELLKIYSEDLELLTPEDCARLHQYASDQEKLGKKIKEVMSSVLLNEMEEQFPRIVKGRKATVVEGTKRGPSKISWEEIRDNKLPISKEVFETVATVSSSDLRKISPVTMCKLESHEWYKNNSTETSSYIKWSAEAKKVSK